MTTASGALLTTLPAASTTLATLGTYASLASAGLGGLSAIRAGDTQAAIGRNNAEIGKINAGAAMNAGEAEAARIQSQTRRKLATGENAFADSGIQTGQGSALDVMGDMAAEGALDTQIARWRGTSAANSAIMQGQQQRVQAGASQTAGYTGAGTTLLTGATTIANQRTYAKAMGLSNGGLFS